MDGTGKRRKDERPGEIVQAATEVFAEFGFADAKIGEIARRANAAKGTVYLYFDTKEALFEAVVRVLIKPAFLRIEGLVASFSGSSSDLLAVVIKRFYEEIINDPRRRAIMRILIAEGVRFPRITAFYHDEVIATGQSAIQGIVKRGIESGEFRSTLATEFPQVIMGPAIMAAIWKMIFETTSPLDTHKFAQAHLDLVLFGLKAR